VRRARRVVFLLERHKFVALEVFYTFVRMIFALFAVRLQNVPNYERRAAEIFTVAANNYANTLIQFQRFEEAKSVLRKMMPVAQRVLGENHQLTLKMRLSNAEALYKDPTSTLDDLREAVATLDDTVRIARRVLGSTHPLTSAIDWELRGARVARLASMSEMLARDVFQTARAKLAHTALGARSNIGRHEGRGRQGGSRS